MIWCCQRFVFIIICFIDMLLWPFDDRIWPHYSYYSDHCYDIVINAAERDLCIRWCCCLYYWRAVIGIRHWRVKAMPLLRATGRRRIGLDTAPSPSPTWRWGILSVSYQLTRQELRILFQDSCRIISGLLDAWEEGILWAGFLDVLLEWYPIFLLWDFQGFVKSLLSDFVFLTVLIVMESSSWKMKWGIDEMQ